MLNVPLDLQASLRLRGIHVVFTIESKQGDLCGVAPGMSMYSINLDQKDELKNG